MSHELRHEVTMVVNGESRKVMVDADPKPAEPAEPAAQAQTQAQETEPAASPKPAAKKTTNQKPTLMQRAKAAVTGKGKKA